MFLFWDGSNLNLLPQYFIDPNKPAIGEYQLEAMLRNLTGLSYSAQEKVTKQMKKKPVKYSKP